MKKKGVETLWERVDRQLVIEAPNRCEGHGCSHDPDVAGTHSEWRESRHLVGNVSIDYARVLLERHAEAFPASGPYRLVEYVTRTSRTMEVIE